MFFGSARIDSRKSAERALLRLTSTKPRTRRPCRGREAAAKAVEWSRYYEDARRARAHASRNGACRSKSRIGGSSCAPAVAPASWRPPTAARYEAGGKSVGLNIRLPFEQGPNRYITEGSPLRVPLLLHAQVLVRVPGKGAGDFSRRLRDARRDVRDPDAGADAQAFEEAAASSSTAPTTGMQVLDLKPLVEWGAIERARSRPALPRQHGRRRLRGAEEASHDAPHACRRRARKSARPASQRRAAEKLLKTRAKRATRPERAWRSSERGRVCRESEGQSPSATQ